MAKKEEEELISPTIAAEKMAQQAKLKTVAKNLFNYGCDDDDSEEEKEEAEGVGAFEKKKKSEYLKECEEELKKLGCENMFVEECKKRGYDDMAIEELINEKIQELKVLNMDIDTLKFYLFPNDPRVPLSSDPVQELDVLQELDGTTTDDILCEKLQHVNSATDKLEEFILDECQRTRYQFNTGYDIQLGKYVNIKSVLFSCPGNMRRGWTYDESAFNQFFDVFPSSCLAVPFHAQSRHHLICESLCINKYAMNITLLVDPNGLVLQCKSFFSRSNFEYVPFYGSDPTPFPFLSRKFELVNRPLRMFDPIPTDAHMKLTTPTFLEDLLCCNTTNFVFRKSSNPSLSDCTSTTRGVYFPCSMILWKQVDKVTRMIELEIIVVYIPTNCIHDLRLYPEFFSRALAKRNISWWVAPFNKTATIILTNFFSEEDRVIIVGPNGLCADRRGAELMQIYGMYAYPFTFDCVVQKTVKELRQVTLENFIKFLEIQGYPPLNGKKVLFYFDWPEMVHTKIYNACKHFSRCKDVCIITVSFRSEESSKHHIEIVKLYDGLKDPDRDKTLELNWHTESADKSSDFFRRFFNGVIPTIVAFGKKGKICSVCVDRLSSSSSAGAKAKVKGNLFEEVSSILNRDVRPYNIDELSNFDEDSMQEMQKLRETMSATSPQILSPCTSLPPPPPLSSHRADHAIPISSFHPDVILARVRVSDIAPYDGAPCGTYLKVVEALSRSLMRHNVAVLELGSNDASVLKALCREAGWIVF
uniref:Uncharacterized protein n=1 Tax=Chenopodium quinoa TaxID=63459 RepID=A0A803L337_CHEQI